MAKRKASTAKAAEKDYEVIGFRLSKREKGKILKQAKKHGIRTISEWLRKAGQGFEP